MGRLIIDGNAVYEIDEECMRWKGQNGAPDKTGQDGRISAVKEDTRAAGAERFGNQTEETGNRNDNALDA